MNDTQDPLFEIPPPDRKVATPFTPVVACTNCCRLMPDHQMIWENELPFCSLECLAEFEHNEQESLFND